MNLLDLLILLPIIYGMIQGYRSGLIHSLASIIAIGGGVIAAKLFAPSLSTQLLGVFNAPEWFVHALAYLIIFIVVTIICNCIGNMLTRLARAISLRWLDRLLGAFFGVFAWALIVSVILNILDIVETHYPVLNPEAKATSALHKPTLSLASVTWEKAQEYIHNRATE